MLCVVAVGNSRTSTVWVAAPASDEDALGVNATNVPPSGDREDVAPAMFGNVGPSPGTTDASGGATAGATPALAAPGMDIDAPPVGPLSGTSMAAPMVAGAAALLRAREPGLSVEETWDRLVECAYPAPGIGTTESEYGLLDVQAAVDDDPYTDDPADVLDDDAQARDGFNESLSDVQGGWLARVI